MYEINGKTYYKITFESDNNFIKLYTAIVKSEDDFSILIETVKKEEIILNKNRIVSMIKVDESISRLYENGKERLY